MAEHKELEADLFGSSSDDEGPPQAGGGSVGGSEGEGQPQADAKATTAALFGSSDEEEEQPGPSHPVTAALGEDEDEYEAGRWGWCQLLHAAASLPHIVAACCSTALCFRRFQCCRLHGRLPVAGPAQCAADALVVAAEHPVWRHHTAGLLAPPTWPACSLHCCAGAPAQRRPMALPSWSKPTCWTRLPKRRCGW